MRKVCSTALSAVAWLAIAGGTQAGEAEAKARIQYPNVTPLVVMSVDGREIRVLVSAPGYDNYGSPLWSHDGKRVAFDAHVGPDLSNTHAFVVNADGTGLKDLGEGAMPTWAPGDQRLAIHRYGSDWGIWAMQPDGTGLERLTQQGRSPRWSPDGTRIAHLGSVGGRGGEVGIMIFNTIDGTDEVLEANDQLPRPYQRINHAFQWSPDGKRVIFTAARDDGGLGVFVYTFEGPSRGPKLRFAADNNRMSGAVAWSPDGKELMIGLKTDATRGRELHRLEVDSDAPPVRLPGQDSTRSVSNVAWSPDGKWIIFQSVAN